MTRVGFTLERFPHAAVARIELARPEQANALDAATVEELHECLHRVEESDAAVAILSARGSTFCGGFDLSDLDNEDDATLLLRFVRLQLLLERLHTLPALTVAVVHGPAVGAGADLALATDVRLAHGRASLRLPGAGFGAVLGTRRLAELTSPSYAVEVAATARRVDIAEGATQGLWRNVYAAQLADEIALLAAAPVPHGTAGRLRAASASSSSDALGDLVRSLVTTPGLHQRLRAYRDRSLPRPQAVSTTSIQGVP